MSLSLDGKGLETRVSPSITPLAGSVGAGRSTYRNPLETRTRSRHSTPVVTVERAPTTLPLYPLTGGSRARRASDVCQWEGGTQTGTNDGVVVSVCQRRESIGTHPHVLLDTSRLHSTDSVGSGHGYRRPRPASPPVLGPDRDTRLSRRYPLTQEEAVVAVESRRVVSGNRKCTNDPSTSGPPSP